MKFLLIWLLLMLPLFLHNKIKKDKTNMTKDIHKKIWESDEEKVRRYFIEEEYGRKDKRW